MARPTAAHAVVFTIALTIAVTVFGAAEPPPLDGTTRQTIIDGIAEGLIEVYVFPDVAAEMTQLVRGKLGSGAYDTVTSVPELCDVLTRDLQSVSHDLHLRVRYEAPEPEAGGTAMSEEEREQRYAAQMRRNNFCFEKVERLAGNIGYVRMNCFAPAESGGDTAVAAMRFVAHCDAVIFDLRGNGGGSPSMIQLISSYFFDEPTHLNSFYIRKTDETKQFWTHAHVDGPRMTDVPVFVLTSGRTFSGAEEFSYNMRSLERGTLVGETTGGGAHPVQRHEVEGTGVVMSLPYGRAVNPVTGTNWEGTGVEPHIAVPASEALDVAHLRAIEGLEAEATDDRSRARLAWTRAGLEARLHPVSVEPAELEAFVGTYGPRTITLEQGTLHYQREGRSKMALVPMGEDRFMLPEVPYFRLRFERDEAGAVVRIVGLYDNGTSDEHARTGP
jgi:hypothetical protein